ncbi:g6593 [Coccomyxa viridis]|uniref:G6593 protein n=1 Tax=Coccomyxa viridis TaxID=1274662 RepID=A0ABP1FVR8_9CHLO
MNAVCKTLQRGSSIRCELNQRVLRRSGTQKRPKEVNVEHLKELSEKYKAQVHVPFHSLNHEDDEELPQSILDKADHDLVEYCNALPGDETSERCWKAVRYFEERKSEAEEACIIEDSEEREWGSAQCTNLERLEDFVRQFVGQAPTHMFVKTLLVLEAADKRATAKQASSAESVSEEEQAMSEVAERRQRLVDLFYAMDTDLNGMLDVGEFREAMRKADHELAGSVVSKVLESMDVHGRLTLEEFLAIADAEEIYANTPLAKWMRRNYSNL